MDIKISMSYIDDEKFSVKNNSGNNLIVDMYAENKKEHMSPMELLLSALTTCAAVDIVSMIKKRRRDFKDIKAISSGKRVDDSPRYYKSIDIKYLIFSSDLKDNEAERFISLAISKYCSVGATIRPDTILNHCFEIIRD
ncbi:MAG: hypothetical protein CMC38_01740 [Flavobacteriaceae bacterium]|nr:hypothetical protein [Flavobacteriaceae bacterium]